MTHLPARLTLVFAAAACAALVAAPRPVAAQSGAFAQAVAEFSVAIEGTYGDEGPRIAAAIDRMAAAAGAWAPDPAGTPVLPLARYAEAYAHLARGEYDAAVAAFRNAAARDPLVSDRAAGSDAMTRAAAALRRGRAAEARARLEASTLLETSSEAHRVLGLAYWADSRDDESIAHLRRAIELNPADERSRLLLSRVLSTSGRDTDAERVLREAVAAIPNSSHSRWWLASVYERLNRLADARRELELAAGSAVSGHASIYAAIGQLATQTSDFSGAIGAFTRAVEGHPTNPVIRKSLAGALLRQDRADEAFAQLTAVLEIDARDAGAHAAIGQIHLDAGRHEDALDALRRAIALSPDHLEARYAMATALMRLGKTDEAEKEFTRVAEAQREALATRRRNMIRDVQEEEAALRREAPDQ